MLGAAFSYALDKLDVLINKGLELYNMSNVIREEIRLLQLELPMLHGYLRDAHSKRNTNPAVKQWVNEVRDVAYRIEDALDTFWVDIEGNHQSSILERFTKKPRKQMKLEDEIKSIRKTLETIIQAKMNLGIMDTDDGSEENERVTSRPTEPFEIDDSEVVGLESDKCQIIRHLVDRKISRRTVLTIVGIGGLGKTTLARKIYKSAELVGQFQFYIWLSISQKFNVNNLLREILYAAEPTTQDREPAIADEDLAIELQKFLARKRYFVVLDDVWTGDLWEGLKQALPDKKNASRVLITSRLENVAKLADSDMEPYKLRYLDEDESLALLFKKAFPNRESERSYSELDNSTNPNESERSDSELDKNSTDPNEPERSDSELDNNCTEPIPPVYPPDLKDVAKQLTEKCGGLPLALIVLGGILSTREPTYNAWRMVNETLDWHYEEGRKCSQVLLLSYTDLPYHLKPCFLYLASFPENYQISTKHIIRMWIAEGFIPKDGKGTIEDRAEDYFHRLVQRCLVQVIEKSWNGNCKICKMQYLLRDIAIHEAQDENFFTVFSKADAGSQPTSKMVRRATLQCTTPTDFCRNSRNIRSLLCFEQCISNNHGFRLLRVLIIEKVDMSDKVINYEGLFEGLIHLRYMGFRYCERMPDGFELIPFSSMKNLETVDWKETLIAFHNDSSPLSLWEVPTLKHVIIDGGRNPPHLPLYWDHLKNLQTLKRVRLIYFPESELEYSINLRTLGIRTKINEFVAVQQGWHTLKNLLKRTEHLVSLSVEPEDTEANSKHYLPLLTEGTRDLACHKTIQCLFLKGLWAIDVCVLSFEMLPPNLTKLTLIWSKLEEDPMPILERLQSVRILRLLAKSFCGTRLTCAKGGFPSLQKLDLALLPETHWDIEPGAMPKLSQLTILGSLHVVPNLQHVPTLQYLKISKYLYDISKAQGHCKIKHIPSVFVNNY